MCEASTPPRPSGVPRRSGCSLARGSRSMALGAVLVIGVNTALRPIVRAINRQPIDSTEEEQHYLISIDCRAAQASEIRSRLVEEVAGVPDLRFSQLDSAFIADTGRVEVTATVTSHKRRELALEAIVGRFGKADGVTRAPWRLNPQD